MNGITYAGAGVAVLALAAWAMRGRLDLIAEHSRDAVRHVLAALLMAGTLAGTVYTFSHGRLSVGGVWESIVSVGGIAAALELGVIYCGWYIGQLDMRIHTARRADVRDGLRAHQSSLYRWFYAVAAISAVANFAFRLGQLGNAPLAAFVSAAPIVLVILFTIKLRPLPRDYQEIGRQNAQRALVILTQEAGRVVTRGVRRMGRGHALSPQEMAQLGYAVNLIRIYTPGEQQQALDHAVATQGGVHGLLEAPGGTTAHYLTTADLARLYSVSDRTAQLWMQQTPGRRRAAHSNRWEAPASAIYAAHGVPAAQPGAPGEGAGAGSARTRNRKGAQEDARKAPTGESEPQGGALVVQLAAVQAQASEPDAGAIDNASATRLL